MQDCKLIDRFSMRERIIMQSAWYGFLAVGTYGIFKAAPLWAAIYAAYVALSFAAIILPSLCAHCPFPSEHATCLFMPPGLLNRFYPYKGPRMSTAGKIATVIFMAGLVIIPNIWLIRDFALLALFWILALPGLAAFPVHYCKRCRHFDCPMNKAERKNAAYR